MGLKRNINRRTKRTLEKIKHRYFDGLERGKRESYYLHPAFYRYYLKRCAWLLVSLLILDKKPYKSFFAILSASYYPRHSVHGIYQNNVFKAFFKALFGLGFLNAKNVYPAYSAKVIHASKKLLFHRPLKPLVSIIIPVYNNLSYTYNCLLSIQDNVSDSVSYEIIVIDDCSTDETKSFFENNVAGVKYIRNSENLGYGKSNNKAADFAEGKYLCLLSHDTEVQQNWIEPLLELINNDKKIGIVGSKLLYPNNLIKEAGGIVYNTGFNSSFGRMDDPCRLIYNFIREVDYCSSTSILLRKSDFERVGKFETIFPDSYHEDIDLCFSIRNILNKKVIFHPLSKVVHFSATTNYDVADEIRKEYRIESLSQFLKKWNPFLTDHDPEGYRKSYRRLLPTTTMLVIGWSLPDFDMNFEAMRLFKLLKIFKSLNLHVVYIPETGFLKDPYYTALINSGIEVRLDFNSHCSVNDFEAVEYFASIKYIWISETDLNILYKDKIKIFRNAKWIYDPVGLSHLETFGGMSLKKTNAEINLAEKSDLTITMTEAEKRTLERYGIKKTCVVPSIHDSQVVGRVKPFCERSDLIFAGDYRYVSNIDACIWLVKEIMPIVWDALPSVRLILLGSQPPQEIQRLSNEKIVVLEPKQNVENYFLTSKMLLAPLRYRINIKSNIGQALEYRLPFVSTSLGIEGTKLRADKDFLLAENAKQFADCVLRLYHDQDLWNALAEGSEIASESFASQQIGQKLLNAILEPEKTAATNEYSMNIYSYE